MARRRDVSLPDFQSSGAILPTPLADNFTPTMTTPQGEAHALLSTLNRRGTMPAFRKLLEPARHSLSAHLSRLRASLSTIGRDLREAVSTAVGRAAAEAMRQAVTTLLRQPGEAPLLDEPPFQRSDQRLQGLPYRGEPRRATHPAWGEPDRLDDWQDREDAPWQQREQRWRHPDDDEQDDRPAGTDHNTNRASRWRSVLAAVCRLAAWLLGRLAAPGARLLALGAGLATALAVWLAGAVPATGSLTDALAATTGALAGLAGR
jgi:hypothetical protein